MRAIAFVLICAITLAGAGAATADDMSNMKNMATTPAARHGHGVGVVTAIDPKAGTLTIQHGPISGVGWPAMTMTFKARPTALLKGLKAGQKIAFDTTVLGASAEVTAVAPK